MHRHKERRLILPSYKHTGIKPFALSSPSSLNQYKYNNVYCSERWFDHPISKT